MTRLRPVLFPALEPEHAPAIITGVVRDLEKTWNLPPGTIMLTHNERQRLMGLAPQEMRFALLDMLGGDAKRNAHCLQ